MRAHVSLNVKDVLKSIEFYRKVFGVEPQKQTSTYAKFDLRSPSLNLALQSGSGEISRVSHFGIEVDTTDEVTHWQKKLSEAGLVKLVETGTDCCFARQDKVWITDPDGNSWEVFYVHEQLPVTEENKKGCCG